jgi:hypothetical protein
LIIFQLIGISGDCVLWVKHVLFAYTRKDFRLDDELDNLVQYNKNGGYFINLSNIVFNLKHQFDKRAVIFKPIIKNMVVEWFINNYCNIYLFI